MPLGLTEPLFVPRYWNPQGLFGLTQMSGFDVESLIFCFGIGGVGAVLYSIVASKRLTPLGMDLGNKSHRPYHRIAVLVSTGAFSTLYLFPWNPIYPAIVAMAIGGLTIVACRSDIKFQTSFGGALFVLIMLYLWPYWSGVHRDISNAYGTFPLSRVFLFMVSRWKSFSSGLYSASTGAGFSSLSHGKPLKQPARRGFLESFGCRLGARRSLEIGTRDNQGGGRQGSGDLKSRCDRSCGK